MNILVASSGYNKTITAVDCCEIISAAVSQVYPHADIRRLPVADGGEGTIALVSEYVDTELSPVMVTGPDGEPVEAVVAFLSDGSALIELCGASGIELLDEHKRTPMTTTTYGTGELVRYALDCGCRNIILALGDSATNDGGTGMLSALGASLLDSKGQELPPGGQNLTRLHSIDLKRFDTRIKECRFTVLTSTMTTLFGEQGTSLLFSSYKGATENEAKLLDSAMRQFAGVATDALKSQLVMGYAELPGAGSSGGTGFALMSFCRAKVINAVPFLLDMIGFDNMLNDITLAVAGEWYVNPKTTLTKKGDFLAARLLARDKQLALPFDFIKLQPAHMSDHERLSRATIASLAGTNRI